MKEGTWILGMTAVICMGLQMGCLTRRPAAMPEQAEASPLSLEAGWTEAGQQEVKDVTCGQRLVFALGEGIVTAVRIEVRGQVVGGSALLQALCSPGKIPFPATVLKGPVEAVIKQRHNAKTLSLDYAPEGVSSGSLTVRVWCRATEWTEK